MRITKVNRATGSRHRADWSEGARLVPCNSAAEHVADDLTKNPADGAEGSLQQQRSRVFAAMASLLDPIVIQKGSSMSIDGAFQAAGVPHKGGNGTAPFATCKADEDIASKEYHTKPKLKEGAAKPTGASFDADVYRQQIARNYTNMQASKARNYGGSGVF
ncbi:hypothetical protein Vretimale_19983 [Volvox reticuliferus]|uniref:Uncharacterized protein n=1 Tax=Volvox reticuliferus TaxID=1737510 RepID=A0A8J4GXP0_9CHLO|nr:hypothetical protein Vretimale_19983 [Volvox reticuliferus]